MNKTKIAFSILTVALFSSIASAQAVTVQDRMAGYKCRVRKLAFTGGANSEVKRQLAKLSTVSLYQSVRLMSGGLQATAPGSLDFKPIDTIVSLNSKGFYADRLYPAQQNSEILDQSGKVIRTEKEFEAMPQGTPFTNHYSFSYAKSGTSGDTTTLRIEILEEQVIDHARTKKATFAFSYEAPASLPPNMVKELSGAATATLFCEDQAS